MADGQEHFKVGKWRVEPGAGQMSDGRETVHVPPRLMQLLELLVDEAGQTVSRDDLIEALWPRGFVNEEALSRAVNELRGLLGDNARNPEFIRTIPKKGYRLIAPAGPVDQSAHSPSSRKGLAWLGVAAAVVVVLVFWLRAPTEVSPVDILSNASRLTSDPGLEWQPEISWNGEWVAQVVARDGVGAIQLFPTSDPAQKREITHPDGLYSPVFSPDSSLVATLSGRGEDCHVLLWPVASADSPDPEIAERLSSCYRLSGLSGLDWSADGQWLAIPARDPESGSTVISRLRLADGAIIPLTRSPDPYHSDERPRFSPNGRWLSFSRGTRAVRELWLQDLDDPDAAPVKLTNDGQFTSGHDWWPDSKTIVFDSDRSGHRALWRVNLNGNIELIGARDAQLPSVSANGSILFQDAQYEANIWRLDLVSGVLDASPLISSTKYDSLPAWSPDGSEIAFSSNRTGDGGIWIASADGSRARLVYEPPEGRAIGPTWVDGGTALLATEYTPQSQRIVRISLNRREVITLETQGANPYQASESPDGQWIYYLAGGDGGGSHLWRMNATGQGGHEQIIEAPLNLYQVAKDGHVYYTLYREPGLWRELPGSAAKAEPVIPDYPTWAGEDWLVHDDWVYHLGEDGLYRQGLPDGNSKRVSKVFPDSLGLSFDIHPDGRTAIVSRTDRAESDLFLARVVAKP